MKRFVLLAAGLFLLLGCRSRSSDNQTAGGVSGAGGAAVEGESGEGGSGARSSNRGGGFTVPGGDWEPVSVEPQAPSGPSCGPGCRLALTRPVAHDNSHGHGFSRELVVDTAPGELFYAPVGEGETRLLAERSAFAYASGDLISYVSLRSPPARDLEVLDTSTGKRKSYLHVDDVAAVGDVLNTFISDKYVFLSTMRGTTRVDLETNAVSEAFAPSLLCDGSCLLDGELLCANGSRILLIDQETGAVRRLDDGGALQLDVGCDPEGERAVWVDFRDPPGQNSSFSGRREAGDIYLYDSMTTKVTRLTHDSPDSPITKAFPSIGSDVVVWLEPCPTCDKSFPDEGSFNNSPLVLVRLDLTLNTRCRLDFKMGGFGSIHQRHYYSYWTDGDEMYLADLELDHPELDWNCE